MIPKSLSEKAEQTISALSSKNVPPAVKAPMSRLQQVFETWTMEEGAFVPIDFSEADLKEASMNLENALRKEFSDFGTELRSVKETYVACMNDANDSDDRIKCRSDYAIALCETADKLL